MIKKLLTALLAVALLLSSLRPSYAEKFTFKKGATSQTVYFRVFDSSSTTGGSLTGLVFNTANLVCYYVRVLGSATSITLATQTVTGAYSSGGFVQVDATNMPGIYRLDLPDAVLATGVDRATVLCKGATNMVPVQVDVELVAYDPQAATNLGLSGLPTANPGANGGLPTTDANNAVKVQTGTGANQLDVTSGRIKSDLSHWNGTAVATPDTAGFPKVTIKDGTGTGEIDTTSGKVAISNGGITPAAFSTTGTISAEAATTLSLSAGVAANDQFNYTHAIQVYAAADNALQASSCVVDTVNGTPDQVITMEDITAFIAVSDPFDIVPAPACATLRPTTLGNKADVTATGEVGLDLSNTAGTIDAAEIGTGAITNAKFAAGAIDAAAIATDAIGAAEIAAGAITVSEAPNLDAAVTTRLATTAFDTKIPTAFTFTSGNVHANAQVVGDKTGYALTSADKLAILTAASGTADSGTTSTIVDAERTEAATDYWKDSCVLMTSGANINQLRRISAFNATTDTITVDPVFTSAVGTDTYILLRSATCTAANVAGNVTVGGYAAGQDPATYVLVTPANKLATDGSGRVTVGSNADKTGYSLTQTFPTNFSALAITAGGAVTVGTNNDKTNYSLNFGQTLPASPTADTVGEGLKFAASRLDAAISTRLASASYTAPDNANITNIRNYLCNGAGTCNAPTNIGVWDRLDAVLSTRLATTSFDTKIPTALTFTGALVRSQVGGIDANAITAASIQDGAIGAAETGLPTGTVSAGAANCNGGANSTTVFATSLNQTVTNFWTNTQLITITSGALSGQTRQISGYTWTGSVGCLTVATAFTGIPADGVSFFIINK